MESSYTRRNARTNYVPVISNSNRHRTAICWESSVQRMKTAVSFFTPLKNGRWDDCEALFEVVIGRLDDIQIGDRITRRKFDPLCDEFYEALEFVQRVEFGTLWIPNEAELLTAE